MSDVYAKYHYFGDRSKSRTNVITFATILDKKKNLIRFAYSCSNNKDVYNKQLGRKIAFERLFMSKHGDNIDLSNLDCKYSLINNYLLNYIKTNPSYFPAWALELC